MSWKLNTRISLLSLQQAIYSCCILFPFPVSFFCVKTITKSSHVSQISIRASALVLNQRISYSANTNTNVNQELNRNILVNWTYCQLSQTLAQAYKQILVKMFTLLNSRLLYVCHRILSGKWLCSNDTNVVPGIGHKNLTSASRPWFNTNSG